MKNQPLCFMAGQLEVNVLLDSLKVTTLTFIARKGAVYAKQVETTYVLLALMVLSAMMEIVYTSVHQDYRELTVSAKSLLKDN